MSSSSIDHSDYSFSGVSPLYSWREFKFSRLACTRVFDIIFQSAVKQNTLHNTSVKRYEQLDTRVEYNKISYSRKRRTRSHFLCTCRVLTRWSFSETITLRPKWSRKTCIKIRVFFSKTRGRAAFMFHITFRFPSCPRRIFIS